MDKQEQRIRPSSGFGRVSSPGLPFESLDHKNQTKNQVHFLAGIVDKLRVWYEKLNSTNNPIGGFFSQVMLAQN